MSEQIRVFFLSQDLSFADPLARALGAEFSTRAARDVRAQGGDLREWCDVVLLDLRLVSTEGKSDAALRLIDEINDAPLHPPAVALCDEGNRQVILDAVQHGAYDTITNPPNMMELRLVLNRAYRSHAAEKELERLRATSRGSGRLFELLGTSPVMEELFSLAKKIAPCDVNVLITGETGTGKELLARAIHQMSSRCARPLVAFSCANLPETLVEDELFGHEKGAFTGALNMRRGRIEAADQSTLFLDEIGDLALGLQPKLLRVLQERTFERLGSNNTISSNIRVICATNQNLEEMAKEDRFREDLYYRLNVVQMHLPPLRERRDDVPLLAQHFLENSAEQFKKKAKRFSQASLHALEEYAWPGNVRELQNAVQRAVVLSEGPAVEVWQLPAAVRSSSEPPQLARSYEEEVRDFKRRLVLRTLRECGWRKAESARVLGVARGYLHRLINQLGIQEQDCNPEMAMVAGGAAPTAPAPPSTRVM
ncbi:MAG TPA: sigma-54 dependent transcriptional regulator [Candidatus Acidoferrales bacterium]|nr:sigma-54 dependent transcriptional regulator [Candidatus Acidoferrales bacterium]